MKSAKSFSLIQEEKEWICVWKNANALSVPSRQGARDARLCVGMELQDLLQQQIYPVHRLDFEVSGLLIFAKTPLAQSLLNKAFEHHQVTKSYRALCLSREQEVPAAFLEGRNHYFSERISEEHVEWRCRLAEGKRRSFPAAHGKETLSRATKQRTLSANESSAILHVPDRVDLWDLQPVTGRRHQLRVHMCLAHHPILGDILYGATAWKQEGVALSAYKLDFSSMPLKEQIHLPDQLVFDFSTHSRKQMSWANI